MTTWRHAAVTAVAATGFACGGGSPASPDRVPGALTESVETAALIFRFSPGDRVDADWQQRFHDWAVARLGVSTPGKLTYHKYVDRSHMERATGRATNGWANPQALELHTIWPTDSHESIHIYTSFIGRPSDFFNEGVAVAFGVDPITGRMWPMWHSRHVHDVAADLLRSGRLVPLRECLTTERFRRLDSNDSYPQAGSFVFRLVEVHGLGAVVEFIRDGAGQFESEDVIRQRFDRVFGVPIDEFEREWIEALRER